MSARRRKSSSGSLVYPLSESSSARAQDLARAATSLGSSPSTEDLIEIISSLDDSPYASTLTTDYSDENALEHSVGALVAVQVYGKLLLEVRDMAMKAEDEADWWASVQRGGGGMAYFLLQSKSCPCFRIWRYMQLMPLSALPQRLLRLSHTVLHAMHDNDLPLSLSSLRPGLIRQLFPSSPKPSALVTSLFPHLANSIHATWYLQTPVQLVRGECSQKRMALERMRDTYAERFARLHAIGAQLTATPTGAVCASGVTTPDEGRPSHITIMNSLHQMLSVLEPDGTFLTQSQNRGVFSTSRTLLANTLPSIKERHKATFSHLERPPRLLLAWPKLILGPPLVLFVGRSLYRSKDSLWQMAIDAGETARSFWRSYVLEPIAGILNTVRTGGDEGMRVINKEGLKSDLDVSLLAHIGDAH